MGYGRFFLPTWLLAEGGLYVLLLFFNDFCHTDLHQICRVGRNMAVDERSEVSFSILQLDIAVVKAHSTQLSSRDIR